MAVKHLTVLDVFYTDDNIYYWEHRHMEPVAW